MEAIARTWNGERPLATTYWLWFIAPGVALAAIAGLGVLLVGPAGTLPNTGMFFSLIALICVGQVVITYGVGPAVIRSAFRSDAHVAWRVLAGAAVVIGMLWIPFGLISTFDQLAKATARPPVVTIEELVREPAATHTAHQSTVLADINRGLPRAMDRVTTLQLAAMDGKILVLGYAADMMIPDQMSAVRYKENNISSECHALQSRYLKGELESLRHRFVFKNNEVFDVTFTARECGIDIERPAVPQGGGNFITKFETDTGIHL